jgi:hypothetical protein
MRANWLLILLAAAAVLAAGTWLLLQECASGGAMGGWSRNCSCHGVEWVVSDRAAADGPRRTVCFGWVSSRSCFQYRDGPEIPCSSVR